MLARMEGRGLERAAILYERAFPELMLLAARAALDADTVAVAAGGAAVAIWSPPGVDVDPEEIDAAWGAHHQAHVDPARLGDIFELGEQFGHFPPTEPHWYLGMLGEVQVADARPFWPMLRPPIDER